MTKNTFLDVPFAEKDVAKSLGAKWAKEQGKWYVPEGLNIAPFARWLPKEIHDEGLVALGRVYIAKSVSDCNRCGNSTNVFCLASDGYEFEGMADWKCFVTYSNVQQVPPLLSQLLMDVVPTYRPDYSSTQGRTLYMNHCDCGAKQGDYYLHSEPGGAFCPMSPREAEKITLYQINLSLRKIPLCAQEHFSDPDYIESHARRL